MGPDDLTPHLPGEPNALIGPERWARLDDYFADRLPLADKIAMDRWVAERDDRGRLITQLRDVWERAETATPEIGPVDIRQVLNTLAERREAIDEAARAIPARVVELHPVKMDAAPRRRLAMLNTRRNLALVFATAAALLLVVGLPFLVRRSAGPRALAVASPMREFATKRAEQATLNLADGSRVVLAAGSRLRIPGDFNVLGPNGAHRELHLEGKAHFVVQHDSARPFIVHTSTAVTEDLGTEFVVSAYPETRATQVAVVSGLVELRRATRTDSVTDAVQRAQLGPGDVGRLGTTGSSTVVHNVALAAYVSWTRGVLAFNGTPVREALAELSRWYDVDFETGDDRLDSVRITGEFKDEPLNLVVRRLALMLGANATQNGRAVLLSPKPISP